MGCEYENKANTRVTVDDVIDLFRPLDASEIDKAGHLLKIVEDQLLLRAYESGKDLDEMIDTIPGYRSTFKSVVVDIVARNLMTATRGEPMASYSESALGYSFSGTFLNPGGGLFIKDAEYKKDETFGLNVPVEIKDVPKTILAPVNAWSDANKYHEQAQDLINQFEENFKKFGSEVERIAEKGAFNK